MEFETHKEEKEFARGLAMFDLGKSVKADVTVKEIAREIASNLPDEKVEDLAVALEDELRDSGYYKEFIDF